MELVEAEGQLSNILDDLEGFFKRHPGYEMNSMTLMRLMNLVYKELCLYLSRSKRYVLDIQEADSDISVREIIKRKKGVL